MNQLLGDQFQQGTKYTRENVGGHSLDWSNQPETFKIYPDAPRIKLPAPQSENGPDLWPIIKSRRSVRHFAAEPLEVSMISQLLWGTQGITHERGRYLFRAAPSAGALYPIETYLLILAVNDFEPGLYHYSVRDHSLEQLKAGILARQAAQAALDQEMVALAPVTFIWTGVFDRSKWKYRQRAYRYVYLDAGHIAAHLSLAATGLGLGSCQIAAFYDDEANALLEIDGETESVIYLSAVGKPARR
jgi:SagB-type dehydrogenase family enzyme